MGRLRNCVLISSGVLVAVCLTVVGAVFKLHSTGKSSAASRFTAISKVHLSGNVEIVRERDDRSLFLGDGKYFIVLKAEASEVARITNQVPEWAHGAWVSGPPADYISRELLQMSPPSRSRSLLYVSGSYTNDAMRLLIVDGDSQRLYFWLHVR